MVSCTSSNLDCVLSLQPPAPPQAELTTQSAVVHLGVEVSWEGLVRFIVRQSAVLLVVQGVDGLLQEHETGPLLGRQEVHAVVALGAHSVLIRPSPCITSALPYPQPTTPEGAVVGWGCLDEGSG